VLIGAVPPLLLQTAANPGGLPMEACDQIRSAVLADRAQFFKDISLPFYGYNRPRANVSQGVRDSFWLQGMMAGLPAAYFCIKVFSETDLTEDLKQFDVPTLILHGERRSDRAHRRLSPALLNNRQARDAQGLSGRTARPRQHAQGPVERRPVGLPHGLRARCGRHYSGGAGSRRASASHPRSVAINVNQNICQPCRGCQEGPL
jgi:pimeloyl-ACP methyl ester carboxylesterase